MGEGETRDGILRHSRSPHPGRIAILCEYATLNGGEQSLLAVLDSEAFARSLLDVVVLAPGEGRFADALAARKITHVPLHLTDAVGVRLPREEIQRQLLDQLQRLSPDLVHANSLSMGRLLGSICEHLGVPCSSHVRDIVGLSRGAVSELNRLDRLLAVSQATRDFHIAQGISADKIEVVYNVVDTVRFAPRLATGELKRELHIPADALLVATIGQIGLRKGQDILAEAVCRLKDEFPQLHVLLVGERNSEKEENRSFERQLHERFESAGLRERVHFLGYRSDMPRILGEVDLLVHPARQEPLGRVLLEAGAARLPIIATAVGGTAEIFSHDEALLIPPDDPDRLTAALVLLLQDESLRKRLGDRARRRIVEKFSAADAGEISENQRIQLLGQFFG
ncbi:MAG: glycosyltransferase family 4 protein [Planctomycetaceae bacterium]